MQLWWWRVSLQLQDVRSETKMIHVDDNNLFISHSRLFVHSFSCVHSNKSHCVCTAAIQQWPLVAAVQNAFIWIMLNVVMSLQHHFLISRTFTCSVSSQGGKWQQQSHRLSMCSIYSSTGERRGEKGHQTNKQQNTVNISFIYWLFVILNTFQQRTADTHWTEGWKWCCCCWFKSGLSHTNKRGPEDCRVKSSTSWSHGGETNRSVMTACVTYHTTSQALESQRQRKSHEFSES